MKKIIIAPAAWLLALSAFAAQFALAQGMAPPNFAGLDANSDGALTADELAGLPPVQNGNVSAETILNAWDADGNGSVSEEEFNNRPAGGMGMGMGG